MCSGPFIRHIFDLDGSVQIPYRRESRGVGLDRVVLGWFVVEEGGGDGRGRWPFFEGEFPRCETYFFKDIARYKGFCLDIYKG